MTAMQRNPARLAETTFDLLIVGGGVFGAAAAWDAVLRGMSVALIERHDFGQATSANSFKMIHGGIRYLQHGDIPRVWSSCRERSAFLRIAPHLVQPLPIVIPTYGHGKKGKGLLRAGFMVYDLLTAGRNRGIAGRTQRIPWGYTVSRAHVLSLFPDLEPKALTGAAIFYDSQMYNPTRLVLAFLTSAAQKGLQLANYVEAMELVTEGGRVTGVTARDHIGGEEIRIKAKMVLNTAGPWAERLLARRGELQLKKKGVYSRDTCFVVRSRVEHRFALAVQGRTKDPDAILARPARHLFAVPWRHYTLIGVWHGVYDGDPDAIKVTEAELKAYMDEFNEAYPAFQLTLDQVLLWNAGLVPFGENESGAQDLSYGKRSPLIDHAAEHGIEGLVTLIGVRYTMARGEAANALAMISRKLGKNSPTPATDRLPLTGGDFTDFQTLMRQAKPQCSVDLGEEVLTALLHNHGTAALRLLQRAAESPHLGRPLGQSTVIGAEIVNAVQNEMAMHLTDVLLRRTDLATGETPPRKVIEECARLMAVHNGWKETHIQQEIIAAEQAFQYRLGHKTAT